MKVKVFCQIFCDYFDHAKTSDDNQSERSSNQKPSCGANLSNKWQRFTVEQAHQLLLDSDSENVLAGNYDTYEFKSEISDVENLETDFLCGCQVPGHISWTDGTDSFSNADATFKAS